MARCVHTAAAGQVLGHMMINSIALPPIVRYGSPEMRARVVRDVVQASRAGALGICIPLSALITNASPMLARWADLPST